MKKTPFLSTAIRAQLFIGKITLAAIAILAFAGQLSAQVSDTTPPEISNLSFTPASIDTTDSSQDVTVTLHAADAGFGVNLIVVNFRSPSGTQLVRAVMQSEQRISGDDKDGIYSAAATFPQYSRAGTWTVFEVYARDAGNNYKTFGNAELASQGNSAQLQVISNNEDTTPPEIKSLGFTPSAIDLNNGTQDVTVTVHATDLRSGIRDVSVYFYMDSLDYIVSAKLNSQNRVSGDDKDGIYTLTATFSQNTDAGIWRIAATTSDAVGNYKSVSTSELDAQGFATQLQIVGRTPSSTTTPTTVRRKKMLLSPAGSQ